MIDNKPAYTVRIAEVDGTTRYFTAFVDGSGIQQAIEIPREVYLALENCRLTEKRPDDDSRAHHQPNQAPLHAGALHPGRALPAA